MVAHDTAAADLAGTTIPMGDVVSRLLQSRASVVLCILDCCFSGVAPARTDDPSQRP